MRSHTAPLIPLLTAATLTCAGTACGQADAPTPASPSNRPAATSSAPATPTPTVTTPATAASVDEMYARAKTAVEGADSVQMTLTVKNGDDSYTGDLSGALDGSNVRRSVRDSAGLSWTTLWVEGKLYIKANKAYWAERTSARNAALLAGHWVRLTGNIAENNAPALKKLLQDYLSDWAPGALRHEVCDVSTLGAGTARRYQAMSGSDKNAFVVAADTWLPSRFTALDPEYGALTLALSDWNTVKPFTAPKVFATVDMADQ